MRHPGNLIVLAIALLASLAAPLRADVAVVNDSGETLYVASGQIVGGRIIYGGWTRVDDFTQATVYVGQDQRIMLAVISLRNGVPSPWHITNSFARADLTVSDDGFRCGQIGGALPQWRLVNLAQNSVWIHDQNNPWPDDMNLFVTTFYVVPGNLDQRFVP